MWWYTDLFVIPNKIDTSRVFVCKDWKIFEMLNFIHYFLSQKKLNTLINSLNKI